MEETQATLFDTSLYEVEIEQPEVFDKKCSQCEHIIGVRFSNGNLFFCSLMQGMKKYGRYGKKITKSSQACLHYKDAEEEKIPVFDGYFGGDLKGAKRG
jgi:hypothetical protein